MREAILEWVDISQWDKPCAVTLTFRQAIRTNSGLTMNTPERCSQNLHHFLNVLKTKCLSPSQRHAKAQIRVIAALEQDANGRYHYHLAVDAPKRVRLEYFRRLVAETWPRTHWGYNEIDFQSAADQGWLEYILKSKPCFDMSIDWLNTHVDCAA